MQEDDPFVSVTTDIAAPPETVWRVLTEFSHYAAWHPVMSLDGPALDGTEPELVPGALLAFRLSGGAAGEHAFTAEVTEVRPRRLLSWQGGDPGVFFGRHTFELEPIAASATRFTDTESWSGTMAASVIAEHRATLEKEYERTGAALKRRAEREPADPGPR